VTEPTIDGINISVNGDRVAIAVPDGRWEGSAAEAERLLTSLHYALDRARPGTNIGSMFINGQLWGGKFIEQDRTAAVSEMRSLIDQLASKIADLEDDATD
jgi:hypothetical protein